MTFEALIASRERLAKTLDSRLGEQLGQHARLLQTMASKESEVAVAIQDQHACEIFIDGMIDSHEPVRLDDINARRQYHEALVERRAALEEQLEKIRESVRQKEKELSETRRCILKNNAQMDTYKQRIQAIERAVEHALDEALNDEVEDVLLGRRRMMHHEHKQ